MKKTVLRYGLYGSISICALFLISWFALQDLDMATQEILGYVSMIISLSFVFFGIKHFRDRQNQGRITFKKALIMGLLISLITALAFGILDILYVEVLNPDFMTEYYEMSLKQMEDTLPKEDFMAKKLELEQQQAIFSNPVMTFLIMFLTVLVIGFIISLISALLLQRKNG